MNDYVLNKKPEPASNETVWAFDLGKGFHGDFPSPRWGEGGRRPDEVNREPRQTRELKCLRRHPVKTLFEIRGCGIVQIKHCIRAGEVRECLPTD